MESELIDEMLRYSEGLELKNRDRVLKKAVEISELFTTHFPERKIKRNVILSSCLYISTMLHGERVTQAILAKAFNISESTLNRRYKEIVKAIRRINPEILR